MSDGVVRWPDRPVTPGRVAVVTVSYNTRELTALLLWSLRRILDWESLEIVVADNGSKDGSAELLAKIDAAEGRRLIANAGNVMHGPALNQAVSFLASAGSELPRWVWGPRLRRRDQFAGRGAPARHVVLGFNVASRYGVFRSWFCEPARLMEARGNLV
jgi:glycosyltransferase involved in cell wall biosynthesis